MARAVQKRTLETRARLIAAAEEVIAESGFEALRVEEVVLRAGVAKGTFFAHFKDKDALMDLIIGPRIDAHLDALAAMPPPQTAEEMVDALVPLAEFITCERYVFDMVFRYSGAASIEEIGPIAQTCGRMVEVFGAWFENGPFRRDVTAELAAEGVMSFLFQAVATQFCALHNAASFRERLYPYLAAWVLVPGQRDRLGAEQP